jgi:hypothetical protein
MKTDGNRALYLCNAPRLPLVQWIDVRRQWSAIAWIAPMSMRTGTARSPMTQDWPLSTLARPLIEKRGRLAEAHERRLFEAGFSAGQRLEVIGGYRVDDHELHR